MSKVRLKNIKHDGPLLLRRAGTVYSITHLEDTQVPLNIAIGMLGDAGLKVTIIEEDKSLIAKLSDYELNILKKEFNLEGDSKSVANKLFPAKKTVLPKKTKPVKTVNKDIPKKPVKVVDSKKESKTTDESSDSA
tara:strand:+ start:150 stop:554 length:405 start_codon:yes stop_codon:yes gene_type:complete